jgi:hypothetical protein
MTAGPRDDLEQNYAQAGFARPLPRGATAGRGAGPAYDGALSARRDRWRRFLPEERRVAGVRGGIAAGRTTAGTGAATRRNCYYQAVHQRLLRNLPGADIDVAGRRYVGHYQRIHQRLRARDRRGCLPNATLNNMVTLFADVMTTQEVVGFMGSAAAMGQAAEYSINDA